MIKAFSALELLRSPALAVPMRQRFADDPDRFANYSLSFGNFLLDYSKNLIDAEIMRHLLALAEAAAVERHRALMFAGEPINVQDRRYEKVGPERLIGMEQVQRTAEYRAIPLFTDPNDASPPKALYLPLRPGCVFQAYVRSDLLR